MSIILQTDDLTARFGGHVAVDAVTCGFAAGQLTAIVGPNGAGKTTYFNLISGQVRASSGRVTLAGDNLSRLSASARSRRGLGRAFQLTSLFPGLSVAENVRLAVQARLRRGRSLLRLAAHDRRVTRAADDVLERVMLSAKAGQPVTALSHGDQRKLEIALLMALEPRVYMFDEPTAGMSNDEARDVLDLIAGLKGRLDVCVLLVEHKLEVIRSLADRIVVLHNGALAADGPPDVVIASDVVQRAFLGRDLADV